MSEVHTTGSWQPHAGSEEAFVAAWAQFAGWASAWPGAGTLRLVRDLHDPGRFVSFGDWDNIEHVKEWKGSREFRERMGQVLRHVEKFEPTELELVATAQAGATTMQAAAGAA